MESTQETDKQSIHESLPSPSPLTNAPETPVPEASTRLAASATPSFVPTTPEQQPGPCPSPDIQRTTSNRRLTEENMHTFYHGKTILLTGATGFIGKAVLWKLLQAYGEDVNCIYILVRSQSRSARKKPEKPMDRIKNEILGNKAFVTLRRTMGAKVFDTIVKQKLVGVAGDMISFDLSIGPKDRERITETVNVIIHCAATDNYNERLDLALETNTLGTLRLMDLAKECDHMDAFLFLSPGYTNLHKPDEIVKERLYPMELGDPEKLLEQLVANELQDIPNTTQRVLQYYPNTYCFTKALAEHSIRERVKYNRQEAEKEEGRKPWPVAIIRATQVGAAACEPMPGWVDGVSGANTPIILMGQGYQAVWPDLGSSPVDIVPVDYLARIITSWAATLQHSTLLDQELERDVTRNELPNIYQVTAGNLKGGLPTWNDVYDAVRLYWTKNTNAVLPTLQEYFPPTKGFTRQFFKDTLPQVFPDSEIAVPLDARRMDLAFETSKASLPFLRQPRQFADQHLQQLLQWLPESDPFISPGEFDWHTYFVNYAFGTHVCLSESSYGVRNIAIPKGWECALYRTSFLDEPIESIVYSVTDIKERTDRMVSKVVAVLRNPGRDVQNSKQAQEWNEDFDSCLDDWCHDDSQILLKRKGDLGLWSVKMDDEGVKMDVLNDEQVGACIDQIISSAAAVPKKTIVGEAAKILQRIRERTQAPYVWFAGAFLSSLLRRLFSSIRLKKSDLTKLEEQIRGKKVVYIPASKTLIDQLVVWYIALRYQLPVPVILCDEALSNLGPTSDILRVAGASFIRRDPATRSPLNTAVTAAYIKVLLRKHGAISMLIEKTRSRTGRIQPGFDDGLVTMVIEACKNDSSLQPTLLSPTPAQSAPKETVIVPINITYEQIPELHMLVQQALGQTMKTPQTPSITDSRQYFTPNAWAANPTEKNSATEDPYDGALGRVCVGFGKVLNVNEISQVVSYIMSSDGSIPKQRKEKSEIKNTLERLIRESHLLAAVVSPIALVASAVLLGRLSSGISIGLICQYVGWLREELATKDATIDWQEGEDVGAMVAYALRSPNIRSNVIIEGKLTKEQSNVAIIERTENVMTLSHLANPLIEKFLPEALFAIVYLSAGAHTMTRSEWFQRFEFLTQLFTNEFVFSWKTTEKFSHLVDQFTAKGMLSKEAGDCYRKSMTPADDGYARIYWLSSFVYPTLDAYWITSCSLSVLGELPFVPRKIVPTLSQWIAAHLISGRQTKYREVLSTESTQRALKTFLAIGLVDCVHLKTKLSADAQILLLELNVKDSEDLIVVSKDRQRKKEDMIDSQTHGLSKDEATIMATSDIASLCHEIELYRVGANLLQSDHHRQNAQVFEKCRNQIRSILRTETSFARQQGMHLNTDEEQMIQLVYSLTSASTDNSSTLEKSGRNHPRRISEAYNLRS